MKRFGLVLAAFLLSVSLAQAQTAPVTVMTDTRQTLTNKTIDCSANTCTGFGASAVAGSNTQVQFNDAGAMAGDSGLTFNKTTDVLTATGGFTGTASAATALAANGANCTAQIPLGVDASGAVEGCTNTITTLTLTTPKLTAGSGTGVTVDDAGSVRTQVYKVTVTSANIISAAVTHDLTIATCPAKCKIVTVLADVTTQFACTAVCTSSTLSATLGITAGGVEFLKSFDLDAAVAVFGDADAEVGSKLDIAANTNGGYIPAWGTTQAIIARFTSGTGNFGNGAATNLSGGSVTFYITAEIYP